MQKYLLTVAENSYESFIDTFLLLKRKFHYRRRLTAVSVLKIGYFNLVQSTDILFVPCFMSYHSHLEINLSGV
jgi:hypothetical protein